MLGCSRCELGPKEEELGARRSPGWSRSPSLPSSLSSVPAATRFER